LGKADTLSSARHEALDQGSRSAVIALLKIGEGFFSVLAGALEFKEENRQGTKEGEIACCGGMSDGASVLILSAVPTVVLTILDGPVTAHQLQQALWVGFLRPEGRQSKSHLVGFLDHLAAANGLGFAIDPNDLRRAC